MTFWQRIWDPEPQAGWVGTYQTIRWFHWKRLVYIESIQQTAPLRYNAMLLAPEYIHYPNMNGKFSLKIWVLPWQVRRRGLKNLFRRHRTNE